MVAKAIQTDHQKQFDKVYLQITDKWQQAHLK